VSTLVNQVHLFKAPICNFFGLKIIQNNFLSKYITSQCSKLSASLSPIQSGKLVITIEPVFASLRHISTLKEESRLVLRVKML